MSAKRRPSRIVYKYVEVPHLVPAATVEEPKTQSPKESLAYRAWANCYQPPTMHFDLPSPTSSASTSSTSSASSSQPSSTSSLHPSASSTSSHGCTAKPSLPATKPSPSATKSSLQAPKPPPPVTKTRAYSSPAILTKPSLEPTKPQTSHPTQPLPLTRSSSRPVETSYTTTTTTITTKDGTFVKKHKEVSSHGFHDGKGAVDWMMFRSPDWEYPLHKKVKGKKVLASYPHCQAW